jgi:hypothetical protein
MKSQTFTEIQKYARACPHAAMKKLYTFYTDEKHLRVLRVRKSPLNCRIDV